MTNILSNERTNDKKHDAIQKNDARQHDMDQYEYTFYRP